MSTFLLAGELYVQAQGMFDNDTYLKLLSVVDSGIKQAEVDNSNFEVEYVSACISWRYNCHAPKSLGIVIRTRQPPH